MNTKSIVTRKNTTKTPTSIVIRLIRLDLRNTPTLFIIRFFKVFVNEVVGALNLKKLCVS